MSGGSLDYVCYKIEDELVGRMEDAELDDLMKDIVTLTHDLEWYLSNDTGEETYRASVNRFKNKWFKSDRETRLKSYIDERIEKTRQDLLKMVGEIV